jgi:cytochrome b561
MSLRNSTEDFGAMARTLHWMVVALILLSWPTGEFEDAFPKVAKAAILFIHMTTGLAVVGLVVIRLLWRVSDPPPAPIASAFGPWADRAGRLMHYALYALLIAVPIAGVLVQFARGRAVPVFGVFEIASPWAADRAFAGNMKEVHEILANLMMILAVLHATAALVHHWVLHDRTLVRMLPGVLRRG